jgi:hypothetical protein
MEPLGANTTVAELPEKLGTNPRPIGTAAAARANQSELSHLSTRDVIKRTKQAIEAGDTETVDKSIAEQRRRIEQNIKIKDYNNASKSLALVDRKIPVTNRRLDRLEEGPGATPAYSRSDDSGFTAKGKAEKAYLKNEGYTADQGPYGMRPYADRHPGSGVSKVSFDSLVNESEIEDGDNGESHEPEIDTTLDFKTFKEELPKNSLLGANLVEAVQNKKIDWEKVGPSDREWMKLWVSAAHEFQRIVDEAKEAGITFPRTAAKQPCTPTYKWIAEQMGISEDTLYQRVSRFRKSFPEATDLFEAK